MPQTIAPRPGLPPPLPSPGSFLHHQGSHTHLHTPAFVNPLSLQVQDLPKPPPLNHSLRNEQPHGVGWEVGAEEETQVGSKAGESLGRKFRVSGTQITA